MVSWTQATVVLEHFMGNLKSGLGPGMPGNSRQVPTNSEQNREQVAGVQLTKTQIRDLIRQGQMAPEEFQNLICMTDGTWNDQMIEEVLGYDDKQAQANAPFKYSATADNFPYMMSSARMVRECIARMPLGPDNHLVDFGAGAGYVNLLAHLTTGCKSTGIEVQSGLVDLARKYVCDLNLSDAINVIHDQAQNIDISFADRFYFFNPFRRAAMQGVFDRLYELSLTKDIYIFLAGSNSHREDFKTHFAGVGPNEDYLFRSKKFAVSR
jgi:hypothetical protein